MIARVQRLLVLALLMLATGFLVTRWQAGQPAWALSGALAILGGHSVVLAIEMVWLVAARGHDPTPKASMRTLLAAWLHECLAMPLVFYWRQPWRHRRHADHLPADAAGRRGVLLVHGFVCNRGVWNGWMPRLQAQGVPYLAVTMEPVLASIDRHVVSIEAAVQRLEQTTGLAPLLVAHSMGGLSVRRWLAEQPPSRVHGVVTLGSPHQGTALAALAFSSNGRQVRRNSPWLQTLAAREAQSREREPGGAYVGFTCLYGNCDNVVFPPRTATLPGADNRLVAGAAHVAMVDRAEAWQTVQQRLAA